MGPRPRKPLGGAVPFLSVTCKLLSCMQRGTAGRVEKPCASAHTFSIVYPGAWNTRVPSYAFTSIHSFCMHLHY